MYAIINREATMNYRVLYRKYRPDSFDNLVGQEAIVRMLKNSIKNDRVSHAYIFSGPRGTGKTSTARIFAKAINCTNPKDGEACGECQNCTNFKESPDIIEIDAASNNGVEEIRELINNVKIMPSSSKYKVYIIDEVHMLSINAFNALLLTLEEPPKHVVFILATTNIENVPITILSRCQRFEFFKIPDDLMFERLKMICDLEKIAYEDAGLHEIVTLADGGLRDALSMLDQLSKEEKKITLDLVSSEIGTVSDANLKGLIDALEMSDIAQIGKIVGNFRESNLNYKVVLKKMIDAFANYAVSLIENKEFKRLEYDDFKRLIFELNDCLNKININVNPYLLVELILLNYLEKPVLVKQESEKKSEELPKNKNEKAAKKEEKILDKNNDTNEEIKNDDKTEAKSEVNDEEIVSDDPSNSSSFITEEYINAIINNCFAKATKNDLLENKEKWTKFIKDLENNLLKGIILDTDVVASSKDYMILTCSIIHTIGDLNKNLEEIEMEFSKLYGNVKMIFVSEERFENEKKQYVKNLKNKIVYEIIDIENIKKYSDGLEEENDNSLEQLATDLFSKDKLEIK